MIADTVPNYPVRTFCYPTPLKPILPSRRRPPDADPGHPLGADGGHIYVLEHVDWMTQTARSTVDSLPLPFRCSSLTRDGP